MEPKHLMAVTRQFKQVFSETRLNALGKRWGFVNGNGKSRRTA